MIRRAIALILAFLPLLAFASTPAAPLWQQPTAAELKMKTYAPDPGAPAVYLYREELVNDNEHVRSIYARVKILTGRGKEMFDQISLPPYLASTYKIKEVEGRTIQSDGTIVPFTGKPYNKLLVKAGGVRIMQEVFVLPDVQVGSILEYRYTLEYGWDLPASWHIQHAIPVMKAHYNFVPDSRGGPMVCSYRLPHGDTLAKEKHGSYDLTIENVPALPKDDYLPPIGNFTLRVDFYYSNYKSSKDFWKDMGSTWSDGFNNFARISRKVRKAVKGIVSPGDSDAVKAQKLYAAVMKMKNTDFGREHTAAENKAEHLKFKYAQDIWAQQEGGGDQITGVFVAMARAAGLKAYAAIVVDRDENIFNPGYLSWWQMDDDLAIVVINGKEVFLDPGQPFCPYGKLAWKHTWAGGIRQIDHGTEIFTSPGSNYEDNVETRNARLTLDSTGHVQGYINETFTGAEAIAWRQAALVEDITSLKKDFQKQVQSSMPPGVTVTVSHFVGLNDSTLPLMAVMNASGTLATRAGKYFILPAVFFEAGAPPLFTEAKRDFPIDMHYPYTERDNFSVTLPAGMQVKSMPQNGESPMDHTADYVTKFGSTQSTYSYGRLLVLGKSLFSPQEYPALRTFFQTVSSNDQQQVMLERLPVTPGPARTGGD